MFPNFKVRLAEFDYDVNFALIAQSAEYYWRGSGDFSSLEADTRQYLEDIIEGGAVNQSVFILSLFNRL